MLSEQATDRLTMDGLAERAGLGKGTVFRRFGTRAGIFQALLDDDERAFQQWVLSGSPPLGPGAAPLERLIAYGRARAGTSWNASVGHDAPAAPAPAAPTTAS
jgi:polyketide synthase 12